MSNKIIPKKYMLLIATILSAMMLGASPMASLLPTTAFAEEEEKEASDGGEEASDGGEEASDGGEEAQLNADSNDQEDISENDGGDNSVVVDPKVQTSVQPDVNVDVNTDVITDEEDCEEATDEVNQGIVQSSDQEAGSDGEVGEDSVYVSPKFQYSTQIGINVYVDTDVILVPGCNPNDEVNQANLQSANQEAGSDVEAGEDSSIIIPSFQRQDHSQHNIAEENDVFLMSLPQ